MATKVIGLDIGTHAVRAVELGFGRGRPVLRRMGQVALPPGAVVAGEVVDPPAVSDAIRRLWRDAGFRDRSVVVGVANARVVARVADLPAMPDDELRTSLPFQVQDLVPMPVDEAELDFEVIERGVEVDGEERVRVLLVAAHRDMIDTVTRAVTGAGLRPSRIDLIPFALVRAVHDPAAWMADDAPGHEVIIGSGAGVTNVVVHRDGVAHFVRTLPIGGSAVTDALAYDMGLDRDDAEALKRGSAEAAYAAHAPRVLDVASTSLLPLANDVASSLDFHLGQTHDGELRRVVLAGGGARLAALRTVLEDHLGVPVVDADPYDRLDVSKALVSPAVLAASADYFAVAIGLALSGQTLKDGERRISLVSRAGDARRAERRTNAMAGAGVAAFAVVLVAAVFARGTQVDSARADADRAEQRVESLRTQVAGLHDVDVMQQGIAADQRTVTATLQGDVAWPALFHDVATMLPSDVWLTSFSASRDATGAGTVQVAATGFDQTSTARWLQRAADVPSLSDVWLTSSTKSDAASGRSTVQFSSTAKLTPEAASDRVARYVEETK